ncbi:MAG TPA: hypothetical protein VIH38_02745, partial [Steroidobacteraceae bacterium]
MIGQGFCAGMAQPGAILPQARQHDLVAVIHLRPAKSRNIPRAGVMPLSLLRRSSRGHQQKRNNEKESG